VTTKTDDLRIRSMQTLTPPGELLRDCLRGERATATVVQSRARLQRILHGHDDRLAVVIGPCSIHDIDAAREYAQRLAAQRERFADTLEIVMRVYFEKPRTTVGWKGLINDPDLDGSFHINKGLRLARQLLIDVNELGLPAGCEFLDIITPQYFADLVAWGAIGARTTESQVHRQMTSGLSMPVGFKNSTDGALQNAINAMLSARHAHAFLGINTDGNSSVVKTLGNQDVHIVLRGGASGTNYHPEDIAIAAKAVAEEGLPRGVMVDCSHDNSGKDHTKQGPVFAEVVRNFANGQKAILGVMIESNLSPGKQTWMQGVPLKYGVSITDSCIGWEETEHMLLGAATLLSQDG